MKIIVAITGASGTIIGRRLVRELAGHEVHLIVSAGARQVAQYEEGTDFSGVETIASFVYDEGNLAASISSSSNKVDAMVICPCSMKTLSGVANGYTDNLITRAADNVLKMGRKLVVVPRETPLSLAALENMCKLKAGGAIILPPIVGYYTRPESIDDVTGFMVGKILDCLDIDHRLYERWSGKKK